MNKIASQFYDLWIGFCMVVMFIFLGVIALLIGGIGAKIVCKGFLLIFN